MSSADMHALRVLLASKLVTTFSTHRSQPFFLHLYAYYHVQQQFSLPAGPVRSHGGGYRRMSQLPTSFWIFTRFGGKLAGTSQLASSLNILSRS
jgi:hypothetical protein